MKQRLKRWIFRWLGKDPEAVVVAFSTGDAGLGRRMAEEVRGLVPGRRHFVVTPENWPEMRRQLKGYRIGLAPVIPGLFFDATGSYAGAVVFWIVTMLLGVVVAFMMRPPGRAVPPLHSLGG